MLPSFTEFIQVYFWSKQMNLKSNQMRLNTPFNFVFVYGEEPQGGYLVLPS